MRLVTYVLAPNDVAMTCAGRCGNALPPKDASPIAGVGRMCQPCIIDRLSSDEGPLDELLAAFDSAAAEAEYREELAVRFSG